MSQRATPVASRTFRIPRCIRKKTIFSKPTTGRKPVHSGSHRPLPSGTRRRTSSAFKQRRTNEDNVRRTPLLSPRALLLAGQSQGAVPPISDHTSGPCYGEKTSAESCRKQRFGGRIKRRIRNRVRVTIGKMDECMPISTDRIYPARRYDGVAASRHYGFFTSVSPLASPLTATP